MYKLSFACISLTGNIRTQNEDNFCFFHKYMTQEHHDSRLLEESCMSDDVPVIALFDGMGGESYGEYASFNAARYVAKMKNRRFMQKRYLSKAYSNLNRMLIDEAAQQKLSSMGTTAVIMLIQDEDIWISNVGDSPAYLFRNGEMKLITVLHTDENIYGQIEGRKPKLTQFLGMDLEVSALEPFIDDLELRSKDKILICSDGLTDMVSLEEIKQIVEANGPKDAVEILSDKAMKNGGIDNTTIILCEAE